ncbi:MAG: regulatory protein RecX [Actinomycetota bacterium]
MTPSPAVPTEAVPAEAPDAIQPEAASPPDFASFFGAGAAKSDAAPAPDARDTSMESKVEEVVEPGVEPDDSARGKGAKRSEARAENVSMRALTRRGMSRWELEKTLLSRELDEATVTAELDRLQGVGLVDDAALAETFVRTQHERKGLGRGAITAELRRRHVDQEHIDAALEQVDEDDEQSRATELAVKRAGQLDSYDVETAKRRLHGFLSRKGYSSSVVRAAIDEALSPRSSGVRFR